MIFFYFICFFIGFTINTGDNFVIAKSEFDAHHSKEIQHNIKRVLARKKRPSEELIIYHQVKTIDIYTRQQSNTKLKIKLSSRTIPLECSQNIATAAINQCYLVIIANNFLRQLNCENEIRLGRNADKQFISIYRHTDYAGFELISQEDVSLEADKIESVEINGLNMLIKMEDLTRKKIIHLDVNNAHDKHNLNLKVIRPVKNEQDLNLKVIRPVHKNEDGHKDEPHTHESEESEESDSDNEENDSEKDNLDDNEIKEVTEKQETDNEENESSEEEELKPENFDQEVNQNNSSKKVKAVKQFLPLNPPIIVGAYTYCSYENLSGLRIYIDNESYAFNLSTDTNDLCTNIVTGIVADENYFILLVNNTANLQKHGNIYVDYCPTETVQFKIKIFQYNIKDPLNPQSTLVVEYNLDDHNESFESIESCTITSKSCSIVLKNSENEKLNLGFMHDFYVPDNKNINVNNPPVENNKEEASIKKSFNQPPKNYFSLLKNKTFWMCGLAIVAPLIVMKFFGINPFGFFNKLRSQLFK